MKIEIRYFVYYGKAGRLEVKFPFMEVSFFKLTAKDDWLKILYKDKIYWVNFYNVGNEYKCHIYNDRDIKEKRLMAMDCLFEVISYKKNKF